MPRLSQIIVLLLLSSSVSGSSILVKAKSVFSKNETSECGQIRTPEVIIVPSNTTKDDDVIILFGQCRSAPANALSGLGDDMRGTRIVMTRSLDNGVSWSPMTFLTERGYSVGAALYDRNSKTIILQYQKFLSANPYENSTLMQVTSTDAGLTFSAARNIQHFIDSCNEATPTKGMVAGAAGSRIQTSSGRLMFSGHNNGAICVWTSDDGGKTYQTGPPIKGDEHSLVELSDGRIYMNGRGQLFSWKGHRTNYFSSDGGRTWSTPSACQIEEPNNFGCDASLTSATIPGMKKKALFFAEPHGPVERISLMLHCSIDDAKTWSSWLEVNPLSVAGYSAMVPLRTNPSTLLVIWEQQPTMLSYAFNVTWCH
jgi:hypothetical protein